MRFPWQPQDVFILKHLDTSSLFWCDEAVLVSITGGSGALRVDQNEYPYENASGLSFSALRLKGVPLIQARLPGCSTCAGMLATGHGIENADCLELKQFSERINSDYTDLTTAVEHLTPLLTLLENGLYVLADCAMVPTDGNGRFFWDVPNQMTDAPATAAACTDDYQYIEGVPSFLYPSQSSDRFDEQRVQHYMHRFSQSGNWPRAISYHFAEYISVLLDGHHKVAAAARLGKEARCIDIIPVSAYGLSDVNCSGFQIPLRDIPKPYSKLLRRKTTPHPRLQYQPSNLISKPWPDQYAESAKHYPDVMELGESIALGLKVVTNEMIEECMGNQTEENLRKLRHILSFLSRRQDQRVKDLALRCGRIKDRKLMESSFKALSHIKQDDDVEQFFVDYLVWNDDKHDSLKRIADEYLTNY